MKEEFEGGKKGGDSGADKMVRFKSLADDLKKRDIATGNAP